MQRVGSSVLEDVRSPSINRQGAQISCDTGNDALSSLNVRRRTSTQLKMARTAIALQLISFLFCCGRCFGKFDSEPERFTFITQISGACD